MKIKKEMVEYLSGEKFSSAYSFSYNKERHRASRIEKILEIIKKEDSIVHLGCCDHIEVIEEKMKKDAYLHTILMKNANNVLGIDINKSAIDYLTKNKNIEKLICADILKDKEDIIEALRKYNKEEKWNYLLAGEMLEHIDNPIQFLSEINNSYSDLVEKIIITVPNAFSIKELLGVIKGKELINTDHRYWFTPYTIVKIMMCSGIEVEDIYFTGFINPKKYKILYPILAKPIMCSSLVAVGRFQRQN